MVRPPRSSPASSHRRPSGARAPLLLAVVLAAGSCVATDGDASSTPDAQSGIWDRALESARTWWEGSRGLADQAMVDIRGVFSDDQDFAHVWKTVVPKLEDTLVLQERQDSLPDSAWIGTDKVSNRAEIDELLDEAVAILATSPMQSYRQRARSLQREIERARADIAEHRQKRVAAPAESTIKTTIRDHDQAIEAREADIARMQRELGQVEREFAVELRQSGLELSDEQVAFLLNTVVGDNMVDLGIVFDNVRAITVQLEQLVDQSGEDLQSARRYYGLYVVLLESLKRMHIQIEEAIAEEYIPQIDSISTRAQALSTETRRLQRESPGKRDQLAANLEAQQLTIEAAGVYRQYLLDQSDGVRKARAELERDIAAAWNTYETVRVSGELVGLVQSSQRLLEGLMNRQVPALRPFENLELRREFEKLTNQLRTARPG